LADIKLFQIQSNAVRELRAESVDIEKSLQSLMEQHLEAFLGFRFASRRIHRRQSCDVTQSARCR